MSDPPIVTITASGPRPPVLHLYEPVSVTWVNQDGRPHEMSADIKTSNDTRCSMVSVGVLAPGESRKTTVLPQNLYCHYRDDARPGDTTFYGFIFSH